MTAIRSLTEGKAAAILATHSVPPAFELAAIPTALASTKTYTIPIVCKRTDIVVGSVTVSTVAGHLPVIGQWKDSMALHPLFSLDTFPLLKYSKNTWLRYCNFNIEEGSDERLVTKQEQALQVAALAILYKLAEIRQDIPWLPQFKDVSNHWPSLMALAWWKHYLDSARFRFPSIHISRMESEFSLGDYLQTCWNVKKSYETTVNERIELEKIAAAEAAMIALRDELAGARPTSNRQIWRWFMANMPKRYKKDIETWMAEIFFAKGEEIRNFTIKDIDMFEEIFLCECPIGTSISHAFTEILASKRNYLQQHFEAFEIIVPQEIVAAKVAGDIPNVMPVISDYPNKAAWMVARAKYLLAHTNMTEKMDAAIAKQSQLTVKPSYKPSLVIRENDDEDEGNDEEDVVLDAFEEATKDQQQEHSGEIEE